MRGTGYWVLVFSLGICAVARAAQTQEKPPTPSMAASDGGLREQARAALRTGAFDRAAELAERAVKADPGEGASHLVLGLAHFGAGRFSAAVQAFAAARASTNPPAPGLLLFNEGSAHFELGRFGEAERAFTAAAAADPRYATLANVNAGHAALAVAAVDRARAYLQAARDSRAAADDPAALEAALDELENAIVEEDHAQTTLRGDEALLAAHDEARRALRENHPARAIAIYEKALAAPHPNSAGEAKLRAELQHGLGQAHLRERHHDAAARAFAAAIALVPADADFHFMAGVADLRRGHRAAARAAFSRALGLGLDRDSARLAREYRDGLSNGLRGQGQGAAFSATAGAGYDSNVVQMGSLRTEIIGAEVADQKDGAFLTANASASIGEPLGEKFFLRASYLLDQIAYLHPDHDIFSMQVHALQLRTAFESSGLHLGLGLNAEYQLAGLSTFAPFQRLLGGELSAGLDEGDHASTWLILRGADKTSLDAGLDYFSGDRRDALLVQRVRTAALRASLTLRHRRENIGEREINLGTLRTNFTGFYFVPYSYRSNAVLAALSCRLPGQFHLAVDGSFERVQYNEDSVLRVQQNTADGTRPVAREAARVRRRDRRVAVGASIGHPLGETFDLALRFDAIWNDSTMRLAFDDKNWSKYAVTLELSAEF